MAEREQQIRARLAAATPGPWQMARSAPGDGFENLSIQSASDEVIVGGCGCCGSPYGSNVADAALIANAPADLAYLLEENQRLREELKQRDSVPFPAHRTLALVKEKAELEADLTAARAERDRLREALADSERVNFELNQAAVDAGTAQANALADLAAARAEVDRLHGVVAACDGERDSLISGYEDALAALRDENGRLRQIIDLHDSSAHCVALERQRDQARDLAARAAEEAERLREALEKYGDHMLACLALWEKGACDCGFEAALAEDHHQ